MRPVSGEALPRIDDHQIEVDAPPERAWEALALVVPAGVGSRAAPFVARALGCDATTSDGPVMSVGSAIPGFRVASVRAPHELVLEGRHRFSRYELIFHVEALEGGRSSVVAETNAVFPGAAGRVYRALVIGSRGHVFAVRRLLRHVRKRAERAG